MAKGYFRRISPTPYPVRLDLSGPVTVVNKDDVIFADVSTFKDVVGFIFVGWTKPPSSPVNISSDPLKPTKVDGYKNMVVVQAAKQVAPHKIFLENLKKENDGVKPDTATPTEIVAIDDDEALPAAPQKTAEDKENDKKALVEYLSKFNNSKWFIMKKEDARDFIDRLELDRSNLPNSKNEFIKLLKDYIKSIS